MTDLAPSEIIPLPLCSQRWARQLGEVYLVDIADDNGDLDSSAGLELAESESAGCTNCSIVAGTNIGFARLVPLTGLLLFVVCTAERTFLPGKTVETHIRDIDSNPEETS